MILPFPATWWSVQSLPTKAGRPNLPGASFKSQIGRISRAAEFTGQTDHFETEEKSRLKTRNLTKTCRWNHCFVLFVVYLTFDGISAHVYKISPWKLEAFSNFIQKILPSAGFRGRPNLPGKMNLWKWAFGRISRAAGFGGQWLYDNRWKPGICEHHFHKM